jgi:hypothetical protein
MTSASAAAQPLMDQPTEAAYLKKGKVNFKALASACDAPPYAVKFDGARGRTIAEVQDAVAQKLAPKLASALSAIGKSQIKGPSTAEVSEGSSQHFPTAAVANNNSPLSADLDGALERGKISVSDTEAIYDVSHSYFCALRALYPSFSTQITTAETQFRAAVDVVFDPDLYKDTPDSKALKQTRISGILADSANWPQLAKSEATIRRILPTAQYDGGFKGDVLLKVRLYHAVDLSTCAGAVFASSAIIDSDILATLNQLRDLVVQSIAGEGPIAVGRLVAGARSTMATHQASLPPLTIRDLVCIDRLMYGTMTGALPAEAPPAPAAPSSAAAATTNS